MPVKKSVLEKLEYYDKIDLKSFINSDNKNLATELAIDLLSKMLVYD